MATFLYLTVVAVLTQGVFSQFWGFGANSCGWRYGGQCKGNCARGEYILGHLPCVFGFLGTCCSATLPCASYGGTCRDGGCYETREVVFDYKVRCLGPYQSCCLRKANQVDGGNGYTRPTTPVPSVPFRCASRRPVSKISSRILGGSPVNNQCQWPWMVSVRLGSPQYPGSHTCAGVLITNNKVLTTVGCVLGKQVFVTLGENDITRNGEAEEVNIAVSQHVIHENFDKASARSSLYANDIAILTLDTPAPSGSCAEPVCLPRYGERAVDLNSCYIAGWGINEALDGILHETNVKVLNNSICTKALALSLNVELPRDKLCSSAVFDGSNACPGDNGGMLVCEDTSNTWSLFGLLSDNPCSRSLPLIYTDIQSHVDWINKNL